MSTIRLPFLSSIILALCVISASVSAKSVEEKRQKTRDMSNEVLERLYSDRPETRNEIENSIGYAVFNNLGVNVVFISGGGGKGVAYNQKNGKETFMKMGTAGVGLGLGVKDFRAVFVFHDEKAFNNFVEKGWDFSGEADAAANSGKKGGELSGASTLSRKVNVYQYTEAGLALQATLRGTKYWKDKKLNKDLY
jgi:lipid-binding SYLF domain-containing protein